MNKMNCICLLAVFLVVGCSSTGVKVQDEGFEYSDFRIHVNDPVSVIIQNDFVFRGMSPNDYIRGLLFGKKFRKDISQRVLVTRALSNDRYTMKMELDVFKGRYRSSLLAILFASTVFAVPAPMEYDRSVKAIYYFGKDKIGEFSFEFKRQTYKGLFTNDMFWEEIAEDSGLLANKALSKFETVILEHKKQRNLNLH